MNVTKKAELDYIMSLKNKFVEIHDSKFEEKKYYDVIMDVRCYDGDSFITNSSVSIEEFVYEEVVKSGKLGFKKIVKEKRIKPKWVSIYAVKTETGIYEMVTGRKLSVYEDPNSIYCNGIIEIPDFYSSSRLLYMSEQLKFFQSNPEYKEQYYNMLLSSSYVARNKYNGLVQEKINEQREIDAAVQYLNSYNL